MSHAASNAAKQRYREKNPAHKAITQAVRDAVKRGLLFKPLCCEVCRQPFPARQLLGHHDDYNHPLLVRWLCHVDHRHWHAVNGRAKNYPEGEEDAKESSSH